MSASDAAATFEAATSYDVAGATLVEGLPGHGLVASIAVDQLVRQLELDHYGSVRSPTFPDVVSFQDGRTRDLVRVEAGTDPAVLTLQSDAPLPRRAFDPLASCLLDDLGDAFDRAIFLAGAPAEREDQIGEVVGIATDDATAADLGDAGVELADGPGVVGGVTGALARACYEADVPAAVLVVRANPYLPDPAAARSVIENALEPLVEFDIDTTELQEQAEEIRSRLEQISQQYRQMAEQQAGGGEEESVPIGYQ